MTQVNYLQFARDWEAGWNSHDLAAETLYFGADGLVTQAAACHRLGAC